VILESICVRPESGVWCCACVARILTSSCVACSCPCSASHPPAELFAVGDAFFYLLLLSFVHDGIEYPGDFKLLNDVEGS